MSDPRPEPTQDVSPTDPSRAAVDAPTDLLAGLSAQLRERSRTLASAVSAGGCRPRPTHVLYWVHHALRVEENPALEVAVTLAAREGVPLLVCAAVSSAHRPLTDRHVAFFLEGLREFAIELAARGVECVLAVGPCEHAVDPADLVNPANPVNPADLVDPVDSVDPVVRLAEGAAALVTDDFPARPFPGWIESLRRRISCPLIAVDGACVVPMNMTDRAYDRAFAFRDATAAERARRVSRASEDRDWPVLSRGSVDHGFPRTDWAAFDVATVVASLEIDHSVGPVTDTPGGARAAEARWSRFRDTRLDEYAQDRNDAAIPATSRMSAYLQFGMIPPMRVAREAAARGGEGAEKFLDELLVWREFAYHWCRHVPDHASMAALPGWARATLAARRGDARAVVPRGRLSRGSTGVRLWDLAQRSLVVHGELHNNLRMTWGKAIPLWTSTPEDAVDTLIGLNDRFALDGGDPSSYAGLLWCLGLFDRPFAPECPVLGRVRPRPIEQHAERIDLDAYERIVARPAHRPARGSARPLRVAVVGAGIAGTACARTLADHGVEVTIVEKSRGPGGRMSTRRGDAGAFDHGAQYFSVRDARFGDQVRDWVEQGVAARWHGRFAELDDRGLRAVEPPPRFVATPAMSALCAHLAAGIPLETSARVVAIMREDSAWRLETEAADGVRRSIGPFDAVLVTAPAPQTAELLGAHAPLLAAIARDAEMQPLWALMVASDARIDIAADHVRVLDPAAALAWISRVSSKPGRAQDGQDRWVALASAAWTRAHLDLDAGIAASALAAAFQDLCACHGRTAPLPTHVTAHRWRFALPAREGGPTSLFDAALGLGAAGDWLRGTRVEDAYLSGVALAGRVLGASTRAVRTG